MSYLSKDEISTNNTINIYMKGIRMSCRTSLFNSCSFNSLLLQTSNIEEGITCVDVEEPSEPSEPSEPNTPPEIIYDQHIKYVPTLSDMGYIIVHVNGTSDDYKFENNANKLILTSIDNQYKISNYNSIVFFGLNNAEEEFEKETGTKIPTSTRFQTDSSIMFKSCIRREILGGDILDRPPSLLCEIIG